MFVFHLKIQSCIIRCLPLYSAYPTKPTTWLWCVSKHPAFQQINVQIYKSLWQLVLTYIKSGKMYLHSVHIDMYSFCYLHLSLAFMFIYSSYAATVAKPITLHSAEHHIIFPPVLLILIILSKVLNKSSDLNKTYLVPHTQFLIAISSFETTVLSMI